MRENVGIPTAMAGWVWPYAADSGWPARLHSHEELEVNLVTRGSTRYLVDGRRLDLRCGTLIWLHPAQEHVLLDESDDFAMWIGVFRPSTLRRACTTVETRPLRAQRPSGDHCRHLSLQQTRQLSRLFANVREARGQRDRHSAGMQYLLLESWSAFQQSQELRGAMRLHPAVDRAVRLLRSSSDLGTLGELAHHCAISPARLSHLFKKQTGVAIAAHRQRMCLERFFELYENPHRQNLLAVALQAGFGSYAQFYRVFRQHTGRSPASWRQEQVGERFQE